MENLVNNLVVDLLAFNGTERAEFNRKAEAIQKEVNELVATPADLMTNTLFDEGMDIEKDYDKALDADVLQILAQLVDKAPNKATRDNAVSDFVKRVNRTFKQVADAIAKTKAEAGQETGKLSYPNLGRSIKDNTPETKWSTKELSWSVTKDKDNNIKKVSTKVESASQSNRTKDAEPEQPTAKAPTSKAELLVAIQASASELGIDLVELAGDLLEMANKANDTTFKVAKGRKTKAQSAAPAKQAKKAS